MIVIESGGTKSVWIFQDEKGKKQRIKTVGLHPQELSDNKFTKIFSFVKNFQLFKQEVYFYGAGCESPQGQSKIQTFLEKCDLNVQSVKTDLEAACVAQLGEKEGIVGILGTGAVAAHFDGAKIIQKTSGWGYMLGDEGSGYDLGKRLLQSYLREELPKEIRDEIEGYMEGIPVLHRIYAKDGRQKVAGLSELIALRRDVPEIKKLILEAFEAFCDTALSPIQEDQRNPIHFIGSIAYYFSENLKIALQKRGYQCGNIHKEAIEPLYSYWSKIKQY